MSCTDMRVGQSRRLSIKKLRLSNLLRVPWTIRRLNQSILKEINPEYSLEGLMLKDQYFGHLMWRAISLEKTLMLGKTGGKRRSRWQRMRWFESIVDSMDMYLSKLQETVKDREPSVLQSTRVQRVVHNLVTEQQQNIRLEREKPLNNIHEIYCARISCSSYHVFRLLPYDPLNFEVLFDPLVRFVLFVRNHLFSRRKRERIAVFY